MRSHIFSKIKDLLKSNMGKMMTELPKIIYIVDNIKESVLLAHPNITSLISNNENSDTVIFVVSQVPSPYVDDNGKMYLNEYDFNNLMPFLMEFFSSRQRGIPINEAFNTFIERLTGE